MALPPGAPSKDVNMQRTLKVLCLSSALLLGMNAPGIAQACPMCKIALEDNPDPAAKVRPKAYMYSILFMLSMPATLATLFGVSFYRLARRQQVLNDAILAEYAAEFEAGEQN